MRWITAPWALLLFLFACDSEPKVDWERATEVAAPPARGGRVAVAVVVSGGRGRRQRGRLWPDGGRRCRVRREAGGAQRGHDVAARRALK